MLSPQQQGVLLPQWRPRTIQLHYQLSGELFLRDGPDMEQVYPEMCQQIFGLKTSQVNLTERLYSVFTTVSVKAGIENSIYYIIHIYIPN